MRELTRGAGGKGNAADRAAFVWRRHCGFADLDVEDFLDIQEQLLRQQSALIHDSRLGRKLLRWTQPASIEEFRSNVPLSLRSDYLSLFEKRDSGVMAEPAVAWIPSEGWPGTPGQVPYTQRGLERNLDSLMSALVFAGARRPGDVQVWPGATVLVCSWMLPAVYHLLVEGMAQRFGLRMLTDDGTDDLSAGEARQGLLESLASRVDVVVGAPCSLAQTGERLAEFARGLHVGDGGLSARSRLHAAKVMLKSRLLGRPPLPKDLWSVKAVLGCASGCSPLERCLERLWKTKPFEIYASAEGGVMGMQTWERREMVFNPYADLFEFVPVEAAMQYPEEEGEQPDTLLLSEVRPDHCYEVVITNFYGMPFVRYRTGNVVRFVDGGRRGLPGFVRAGRVDDCVEFAGGFRLDERLVWEALRRASVTAHTWVVRREQTSEGAPGTHLAIELEGGPPAGEVQDAVRAALRALSPSYLKLETSLRRSPLRVSLVSYGTLSPRCADIGQPVGPQSLFGVPASELSERGIATTVADTYHALTEEDVAREAKHV